MYLVERWALRRTLKRSGSTKSSQQLSTVSSSSRTHPGLRVGLLSLQPLNQTLQCCQPDSGSLKLWMPLQTHDHGIKRMPPLRMCPSSWDSAGAHGASVPTIINGCHSQRKLAQGYSEVSAIGFNETPRYGCNPIHIPLGVKVPLDPVGRPSESTGIRVCCDRSLLHELIYATIYWVVVLVKNAKKHKTPHVWVFK